MTEAKNVLGGRLAQKIRHEEIPASPGFRGFEDRGKAPLMWKYRGQTRPEFAETPGPGQESVRDYPRPPTLSPDTRLVDVI